MIDSTAERCEHCDVVYRERAQVVAFLTSLYPSVIAYNDPEWPEYPVLYVASPVGQLSWHLSARDLDLFEHVPVAEGDHPGAIWDGHTTEQKYARLAELGELTRSERTRT
jgi:predicted DNA-binding protein with PD1-like motif